VPVLRVLQVSWEYPPVMYGGLGRHVDALSHALAEAGADVVVLTQGPPDAGGDVTTASGGRLRVQRVALPPAADVHADTAGFVRLLGRHLGEQGRALVDAWQPDVVHGHDWVVADAAGAIADHAGVPLVMTVHATELGLWSGWLTSDFSRWRTSVERALVARADLTLVCSQPMRSETVDGLQADPARTLVVPNGVEVDAWVTTPSQQAAARAAVGVPEGTPMVVLVGRLEYEKGGQDAIDALALLPGDVHLVLVGIGGRRDALAAQAVAAGLPDRVHLVGRLRDDTVAALLGAADVAVVPSRYEPFGLVALEAMAAGTPVVVTRTGGLGDLVRPGETGLVVPPAAPAALAEAVGRLLADPEGRVAMAQRARTDAAERFGWDTVARRTLQAYSSVLAVR
jgi:glycogen(starch) synthase